MSWRAISTDCSGPSWDVLGSCAAGRPEAAIRSTSSSLSGGAQVADLIDVAKGLRVHRQYTVQPGNAKIAVASVARTGAGLSEHHRVGVDLDGKVPITARTTAAPLPGRRAPPCQ